MTIHLDTTFNQEIYDAIRAGKQDIVKDFINNGGDVNAVDPFSGYGYIEPAVRYNHIEIVTMLLDAGVDINVVYVCTPLATALSYNRIEIAQLLLSLGADVNIPDVSGITPLMEAMWIDRLDVAQMILDAGANINAATNKRNETVLHMMMESGKYTAVSFLLARGADPARKDSLGAPALTPTELKTLIPNPFESVMQEREVSTTSAEDTPFSREFAQAVTDNDLDTARRFIKNGGNIHALQDFTQYSYIHLAAKYGRVEIIEMLISAGADINLKEGWRGETPLTFSIRHTQRHVTKMLLSLGADVNISAFGGMTPLMYSILTWCPGITEMLITAGADVTAVSKSNDTALHLVTAKRFQDTELITRLLAHGADPTAVNDGGVVALSDRG